MTAIWSSSSSTRQEVPIFLRHLHRVAERAAAARDDADLADRIAARDETRHERVTALVERDRLAFLGVHDAAALLEAADHALDRRFEIGERHGVGIASRRQQRGLVDDVREIGAAEAGRNTRGALEIEIGRERDRPAVDLQDLQPASEIGIPEDDLAIEASRAQQRRIEDLGPVRRRHDDDRILGVRLEAVDLRQELIQRLLAFVVRDESDATAAALADGVDLVDEHDRGRGGPRLLEQIAHARGADADEHLDELRSAGLEEPDAGFACGRLRDERLAGSGRPDEQHAFRNPSAEPRELLRRLQELDDLLQFGDRFVGAADVLERDADFLGLHLGRLALADAEDPAARSGRQIAADERPQAHDQQERQHPAEDEARNRTRGARPDRSHARRRAP